MFIIIFEIVKNILSLIVLFQYAHLFITSSYSRPVKQFSNRLSSYAYRIMRYLTLNESTLPFPFTNFPEELESPQSVHFDKS